MININSNRVNIPAGGLGKAPDRRRDKPASGAVVPKRAEVGIIPQPESLATLIRSAVAALREGVYWDRGTILNILA